MLCYRCGTHVSDDAFTCSNCGAELGSATRAMRIPRRSLRAIREAESLHMRGATREGIPYDLGDEVVGRYTLLKRLGEGPFGLVFTAFDQELEREVAVKILRSELLTEPSERQHFEDAVRSARRLSQHNIVRLHESGFERGCAFITMQHLAGLNLRRVMELRQQQGPAGSAFSPSELEPIARQLISALRYSHLKGAHGNLKPENIILQPDDLNIKITDFYICPSIGVQPFVQANADNPWLAPEVRADPTQSTPRSDIYSLGMMIAAMLAGQFDAQKLLPLSAHAREDLPTALDRLLEQATATAPDKRPASLDQFAEELFAHLYGDDLTRTARMDSSPAQLSPPPPPGDKDDALMQLSVAAQDLIRSGEFSTDLGGVSSTAIVARPVFTPPPLPAVPNSDDEGDDGALVLSEADVDLLTDDTLLGGDEAEMSPLASPTPIKEPVKPYTSSPTESSLDDAVTVVSRMSDIRPPQALEAVEQPPQEMEDDDEPPELFEPGAGAGEVEVTEPEAIPEEPLSEEESIQIAEEAGGTEVETIVRPPERTAELSKLDRNSIPDVFRPSTGKPGLPTQRIEAIAPPKPPPAKKNSKGLVVVLVVTAVVLMMGVIAAIAFSLNTTPEPETTTIPDFGQQEGGENVSP